MADLHSRAQDIMDLNEYNKEGTSMTYYDEKLKILQEKSVRFRQLSAMLSELRNQKNDLQARVCELEKIKLDEQADVDKLEKGSLASFSYNVIGKMDEHLTKEREEAYAAKVKYDTAAAELKGIENDISRYEREFAELNGCEKEYISVLKEKSNAVKAAGGIQAEEILKTEERLAFLESQKKELQEAILAGNRAKGTADNVLNSLSSAEGWGTWDLLGGGLLADVAKHSHLDEAQSSIERLQSNLRQFKTELADITINADFQVNIDGFLRFADYFFDGLFADWAVMDKISQAKNQVYSTKSQIDNVLLRLNDMMNTAEQEKAKLYNKLNTLITEAKL